LAFAVDTTADFSKNILKGLIPREKCQP